MLIKINKKFYARIYFNQIQGSLYTNGRLIKEKSTNIKIFNNLLNSLSISVNIIYNKENNNKLKNKKNNKIIITKKILLKLSKIIKNILKNNIINNNDINQNNNDISFKQSFADNFKNILNSKNTFLFGIIFIFLILIFIYDYKSIEAKINQANYLEIKKIESDYNINKCKINGDLPSLKQKCELMLDQIELLKTKKPSLISVFFIWLMDIVNSYFTTFNFSNCIITIIFLIIIYKI